MQRLVRRMTRFFVKTNAEDTMSQLIEVLEKAGYGLMKGSPGQVCDGLSCSNVWRLSMYVLCNLRHPFLCVATTRWLEVNIEIHVSPILFDGAKLIQSIVSTKIENTTYIGCAYRWPRA